MSKFIYNLPVFIDYNDMFSEHVEETWTYLSKRVHVCIFVRMFQCRQYRKPISTSVTYVFTHGFKESVHVHFLDKLHPFESLNRVHLGSYMILFFKPFPSLPSLH